MSHLIKIYPVCKFSYFRLWYLKSGFNTFIFNLDLECLLCYFSVSQSSSDSFEAGKSILISTSGFVKIILNET